MSTVRELYERFRHLIQEGSKFLVIGALGAVITFGVANALHDIGRYKAITIATILATVFTYLGNRYWSFKHRQGQGEVRDSVIFFVLNAIGLLIYYACIGLTDVAGQGKSKLWYNVALVVGTLLGTLFRFWSYRKWVWVAKDHSVLEPSERPEEIAEDLAAMVGAAPVTHHGELPSQASQSRPNHAAAGSHRSADPHRSATSHRAPASHRRTK